MKRTLKHFAIGCATAIGILTSGCAIAPNGATTQPAAAPTLQQQLQAAQLAFTAAEGIVAGLEAANVIKPAQATQINALESAAAAALATAAADVAANDSQAQTAIDTLDSAIAAYSQAIVKLKSN
jgi:hypothetical protein